MMQTAPGHATANRWTIDRQPGRPAATEREPLTPAEQIALTIALLNRGLDLMDGLARTSLAGCARVAVRGHYHPQGERQSLEAS